MAAPTTHADDKTVDSFTIRGTNQQVVRAGDCVLIRPSWRGEEQVSSVARVEKLEKCCECTGVAARIRWYYSPQETKPGRRSFHGEKELCLTDHLDTRSAHTIEGKCTVHSLTEYAQLGRARPEDFFCRSEYEVANASMTLHAKQYCYCKAPYNPDIAMIFCYACRNL